MYAEEWAYIFKIIGILFCSGMIAVFSYILWLEWRDRDEIPRVP